MNDSIKLLIYGNGQQFTITISDDSLKFSALQIFVFRVNHCKTILPYFDILILSYGFYNFIKNKTG